MMVHSSAKEGASIPGASISWRTVYPDEWRYDGITYIWSDSLKDGETPVGQVRGWGYLTGRGHGALALSEADAIRVQAEIGALFTAAPNLLDAAIYAVERFSMWTGITANAEEALEGLRAAIAKATATAETSAARYAGEAEVTPSPSPEPVK